MLFNQEMSVRKCSNLRQMCNAENLAFFAQNTRKFFVMVFCVLRQYNYFRVLRIFMEGVERYEKMDRADLGSVHIAVWRMRQSDGTIREYSKIIILPQHTKNHYKKLTMSKY
mgnify:CR=1 FL=1